MGEGAQLCVSCGYNMQSGKALSVKIKKSPREPMLGGWVGPILVAIIPTIAFIPLFTNAGSNGAVFGAFVLGSILCAGVYMVWMLRLAGKHSSSTAASCYLIPFYFLYFVFCMNQSRYLKAATIPYLLMISLLLTLFLGPEPAFMKADRERQKKWEESLKAPARPRTSQPPPSGP